MRYTFHGLMQTGDEHPKVLRAALLKPQAVKLAQRLYGEDSYENGAIWRKGGCLLLAVALGSVLRRQVVLIFDEEGSWWHAAVELDDGKTVDYEQYGETVAELEDVWSVEAGDAAYVAVETPEKAARRLDADEKAALPELQSILKRYEQEFDEWLKGY